MTPAASFHRQIETAIDNCAVLCSKEPDVPEHWQMLGRALTDAERFDEAGDALERFFETGRFFRLKKGVPRLRLRSLWRYRRNRVLFAKAYADLGAVALNDGDLAGAQRLLMLAMREFEREKMDDEYIRAAHCLGTAYRISGNFDNAEQLFSFTEKTAQKNGWQFHLAAAKGHLGLIAFAREKFDDAVRLHNDSAAVFENAGFVQESAWQKRCAGVSSLFLNRENDAFALLNDALAVFKNHDNKIYCARVHDDLAAAYAFVKDDGKTLEHAENAVKEALLSQNDAQIADSRFSLARHKMTCGREDDTLPFLLTNVLSFYREKNMIPAQAEAQSTLGLYYLHAGNLEKAESCFKDSLRLEQRLTRLFGQATDYANLGLVFQKKGNTEQALSCYEKARDLFVADGNCLLADDICKKLAELKKVTLP